MITDNAPIRRRKLADDVQERVLSHIQERGLKPGDTLPSERELMATFQVGRPAIREAMQNLQWMGLVDIRHGERPKVAEPSVDNLVGQLAQSMRHLLNHSEATLRDLLEARVGFETAMAATAAQKRSDRDVDRLRASLDEQKRCQRDPEKFLPADGEFHRMIARMSGNRLYETISVAMFGWLAQFHVEHVRILGLEHVTLAEHEAILNAIAAGDPVAAAKSMSDHLNRVNRLYHQE